MEIAAPPHSLKAEVNDESLIRELLNPTTTAEEARRLGENDAPADCGRAHPQGLCSCRACRQAWTRFVQERQSIDQSEGRGLTTGPYHAEPSGCTRGDSRGTL